MNFTTDMRDYGYKVSEIIDEKLQNLLIKYGIDEINVVK